MRLGRAVLGVVGALALVTVASPAVADPSAYYQMPFPCGEKWTGSTRSSHSPSSRAIDWNRPDDLGDPVVAAAPGVVTVADTINNSGYGRWVTVDHGNNEKTIYAHLSAVNVTAGQRVDQGELLGLLGSTGNSTGPHLHFEERLGSSVIAPFIAGARFVFGTTPASKNCVEVPMAVDWNGDGKAEPTVYRRVDPAAYRIYREGRTPKVVAFGTAADDPVPGDWDGNGTMNLGVRSPSTKTFAMRTPKGTAKLAFGLPTDKPIAGDWDGDRKWTPGLWRSSISQFILRHSDGTVTRVTLGDANDLPVTGDWDGDGRTDVGVYDQATASFTLRKVDEDGLEWTAKVPFGTAGDLPAVGDWDGNGKTDLGVWSPRTGTFVQRKAPAPSAKLRSTSSIRFGKRRL